MLKTKNLQKIFSKEKSIKFSDINLGKNQILFIKWPSWVWKTTLMKILAKLDLKYNWDYKTNFEKSEIWYFFHDYRLISSLSIKENIFFGNIYKNIWNIEMEKEIEQIAKKLDISDKLELPVKKLSSGQYQRICLIRSFIWDKKLFLLDEPTSHLDKESSEKVWEIIFEYYQKWAIFILSSHDDFLFSFLSKKLEKENILTYEF